MDSTECGSPDVLQVQRKARTCKVSVHEQLIHRMDRKEPVKHRSHENQWFSVSDGETSSGKIPNMHKFWIVEFAFVFSSKPCMVFTYVSIALLMRGSLAAILFKALTRSTLKQRQNHSTGHLPLLMSQSFEIQAILYTPYPGRRSKPESQ